MNKLRHDIEDKDQELAKKEQALKQAEQCHKTACEHSTEN